MAVGVARSGCATRSGPGRSGLLFTEVLMQRRPRQTSPSRIRAGVRPSSLAAAAVFAGTLLGLVAPAGAQLQNAPIDLEIFRPAMDSKGFVTVNSSGVLGQYDISFGLVTSYARRPLRFTGTGMPFAGQNGSFSVDTLVRPSLQAAVGFFSLPHFGAELGVIVPMGITAGASKPSDDGGTPNSNL